MHRRVAIAALVSLACAAAFRVGITRAQTPSLTLRVEPARVEFLGTGDARTVKVIVTGGTPGIVTIAPYDAVVVDGGWQDAPYGSTAATLAGVLRVEPTTFRYEPGEVPVVFEATASLRVGRVDVPRVGSLLVTLGPEAAGGALVVQQAAVQVQVLATPDAAAIGVLAPGSFGLEVGDIAVTQDRPVSPVDLPVPDLPGVVGRGPISTALPIRNTGDAIVDAKVSWEFHRIGVFRLFGSSLDDMPYVRIGLAPRYVLPGARFTSEGSSSGEFESGTLDAMPLLGFVRIVARVEGTLGGVPVADAVATRTIFVFPWAEALVLVLGWVAVGAVRRRRAPAPVHHRSSEVTTSAARVAPAAPAVPHRRPLLRDLSDEEIEALARDRRAQRSRRPRS